jgi:hypothetical protein
MDVLNVKEVHQASLVPDSVLLLVRQIGVAARRRRLRSANRVITPSPVA